MLGQQRTDCSFGHYHQPQEETCWPATCWWHPPLTDCFGWAGFPKLEDLADRRSSYYLPSCNCLGLGEH